MLPRPYHTVHTYLIGLWTLQRNHGHTGGTVWRLGGGFDGLLESEVSNLWAKHGQNNSCRRTALGKSGNTCLLRRFEACPWNLISIINITLSYVLIYVCRLGRLRSFGGGRWKGFLLGCLGDFSVRIVCPSCRRAQNESEKRHDDDA